VPYQQYAKTGTDSALVSTVVTRASLGFRDTTFVRNSGNFRRAAFGEGGPVSGTRATSSWAPGERIVDRYLIQLPADAPPGSPQHDRLTRVHLDVIGGLVRLLDQLGDHGVAAQHR